MNIYPVVLIAYLAVLVFGVTALGAKRTRSFEDFTTGRGIYGGLLLGLVVWATKVTASAYMGGPALAYTFGFSVLPYGGWLVLSAIVVTIIIFLPLRRLALRLGAQTPMEVIGKRFESKPLYALYSLLVCFAITLSLIAQFKASGILMQQIAGFPMWLGVVVSAGSLLVYSFFGGRHAGIFSDAFQGLVMVAMVAIVIPKIWGLVGGITSMHAALSSQDPRLVAFTSKMFPLAAQIAMPFYWLFAFITQPYSMHLALSARSQKEVRKILVFEYLGYLTTLIWFIFVGFGGRILFPGLKQPDALAVVLLTKLLSPAFAALCLAVLWSIASIQGGLVLTGASAIANDLYRGVLVPRYARGQSEETIARRSVILMRAVMSLMVAIAVVLTLVRTPPFLAIMMYVSFGLFGSASTGLFVGALWWRRATAAGGLVSMILGFAAYAVTERLVPGPFVAGAIGGAISLVSMFLVSLVTKAPRSELVERCFGAVTQRRLGSQGAMPG
ncbi:MAG: sodium:solute symporter family protein [Bacillota bacterium]